MQIRPIEEQDFPALVAIFQEFAIFEKMPDQMNNTVERMQQEAEFFKGFVTVDDNNIVAYVTYFFTYHTWTGKCLYMDDLYVTEPFRGQGLGGQLLKRVIALAKEEKCHDLRWQVSNWNKNAIEFYESVGATIDSTEWNCKLLID